MSDAETVSRVLGCLRAVAEGPFFEDWEFYTPMGATRGRVASLIKNWEGVDLRSSAVNSIVLNALNHLDGYPHGREQDLDAYLPFPPTEIDDLREAWKALSRQPEE